MRKISALLIALLFLAAAPKAKAQEAYEEGDIILNAGITLGGYGYGYLGDRNFTIPITLSGEYGVHEYFSVGAMLGYARYSWDYSGYWGGWEYSATFISFGARGSFHYLPLANEYLDLDIDSEKFDFYLSLFVGLENTSWKYDEAGDDFFDYNENDTDIRIGTFAGFKYMVNENFGLFLEGGPHAFGYLTLGASLTF
ncbi:MAG: hypothetical protein ACOC0R_03790 [Mariniphaga sp.]